MIGAQNVDNSTRRRFSSVFAAQLACSDEARNNIAGSGFYKSFAGLSQDGVIGKRTWAALLA